MSSTQAQDAPGQPSLIRTRIGVLTLLLLCGVQFLDVVDSSITNVAFPSIQRALHISQQNLQWVASGYLLTYGGFLLLGGRLADLLGRRRILVAGLGVFAVCSLAAGLAQSEGVLIGARVLQGVGAAMMAPAALSILTTTFREGRDRNTALGVWGAISGLAAAAGVFLGGVLSEGPGWRWVFYVNVPLCLLALGATFGLLSGARKRAPLAEFDTPGALLGTAGMLLLVYALIKAPDVGWGSAQTIGMLAAAALILLAFLGNEVRSHNPLLPLSIFRVKGLAAADATWLIAMAGFF
ncbi:MAG TPA: MFS transporter, partial [Chloroflexota bacterium]